MMPSLALAGDKIEFSAPGASIELPKVEHDDKGLPKLDEFQPPVRPDDLLVEDSAPSSSEFLIIPGQNKKDAKRSDPAFADGRDNDANPGADGTYDNLVSKRRPATDTTDRWDTRRGQDPDAGSAFSEGKNDKTTGEESLRSRLEMVNTEGRTDYQKDGRYGERSPDSSENTVWTRSLFNHGFTGLERMREGQFVPFYDEVQGANQEAGQGFSTARSSSAADDQLRDSTLSPGVAAYNAQADAVRGKTPDGMTAAPRTIYPVQTQTVTQIPDVYARQEPPASPPGQVQSRPAILPFPKKPGDVLR